MQNFLKSFSHSRLFMCHLPLDFYKCVFCEYESPRTIHKLNHSCGLGGYAEGESTSERYPSYNVDGYPFE